MRGKLGAGAFGTVYRAYDPQLEREVALKVPRPGTMDDPKMVERFLREAKAAARLRHAHIVPVFEAGKDGDNYFIASAFIEGKTLAQAMKEARIDFRQAAQIVGDLAEALDYAHQQGIVHRDVKPANILIDKAGKAHLMDFGLAYRHDSAENLTQDGAILGTPAYMAPEQAQGRSSEVNPASDQYSLGIVLYELLCGQTPFSGPPQIVIYNAIHCEPPSPNSLDPQVPVALERICLKAIAKKPAARYATAALLSSALEECFRALDSPIPAVHTHALRPSEADSPFREITAYNEDGLVGCSRPRVRGNRERVTRWVIIALSAIIVSVVLGVVIYVATDYGTVKIELNDPAADVEVKVDGNAINVSGLSQPLRLQAGKHGLIVTGKDFETVSNSFTVRRGANPVLRVELVRNVKSRDTAKKEGPPKWITGALGKARVPESQQVVKLKNQFRESYKADFAMEKLEEKARLAKTLLERCLAAPADRIDARYALLDLAREVASDAGDFDTAMEACNQIHKWFVVDLVHLKVETVKNADRLHRANARSLESLTEAALSVGFEAIALDQYQDAKDVAHVAKKAAEKMAMPHLSYQADFLAEELERAGSAYDRVKGDLATARNRSDDPQANAKAGKFLCLVKNEWDQGLPMLLKGNDSDLKGLAERELKSPTTVSEREALGDLWWQAAEKVEQVELLDFQRRAKHWYLKALALSRQPEKAMLAERLLQRVDKVPSRSVTLRIQFFDTGGKHSLRLSNDGITHSTDRGAREVRINHLRLPLQGAGNSGTRMSNSGAWRLFPDAVDFSDADVVKEWNGPYGSMTFRFGIDDFVIEPRYSAGGQGVNFDITVTFQSSGFWVANRLSGLWDVKFYKMDKLEREPTSENWDKIVRTRPTDQQTLDRIDFRACEDNLYDKRCPPPSDKIPHDWFALVGTSNWDMPAAGRYEIRTRSDDGIRVFVDNQKVIDNWKHPAAPDGKTDLRLSQGTHRFRVEYYQISGPARLQFAVRRTGDS